MGVAAVVGFGHRVMILLLNSPQDLAPLLAANILGSHCGRAELPVHFGLDRRPARGVRITGDVRRSRTGARGHRCS